MNKPYSIGLDIGTSSVGWSIVTDDYLSLLLNTIKPMKILEEEKDDKTQPIYKVINALRAGKRINQLIIADSDHLFSDKKVENILFEETIDFIKRNK